MDITNHIVLIGKQGSGKTSLAKALGNVGFTRVIACTTRPRRSNEINGMDYSFLTDEAFNAIAGDLVAVRSYETVYGEWRYGIDLRDINADGPTVCILDPGGYLEIRDKISNRFTIYLDPPRDIRINRVLARGDDPEEVARREEDDDIMFGYLDERYQELCDLRIARERSIEDDVARIQRYLRAFNDGSINYDGRPGE